MLQALSNLVRKRRVEFEDTYVDYVRSKQDEQLEQIEIATARFWDKDFIANVFISKGRKAISIDTTTFRDRISVITKDGEYWTGTVQHFESNSILELKMTAKEIAELQTLD